MNYIIPIPIALVSQLEVQYMLDILLIGLLSQRIVELLDDIQIKQLVSNRKIKLFYGGEFIKQNPIKKICNPSNGVHLRD